MASIQGLARAVGAVMFDPAAMEGLPNHEVVRAVTAMKGFGPWSAQMFLLFRLGSLDVMPCGDLGIQEGLKRLDSLRERPTPKQVLARSEPWRPLRSVASWYLYRLNDEP